jgi:hypothetical protein
MSVFRKIRVTCPNCQTVQDFRVAHSVNADLRDDLRLAILGDEFQRVTCSNCTEPFRLEPEFTFVDVGRHLWIAALPLRRSAKWKSEEDNARVLFDGVYGPRAPLPVQDVGRGLQPRLVFGWAALREKLLVNELELDDATVELCKAAVMRNSQAAQIGAQTELRLLGVTDGDLVFAWILAADETVGDTIRVKRSLYDLIAADEAGDWSALRSDFTEGMFVDLNRLTIAAG